MRKVLLLDPNWPQSGYLILSLRKAGFDVVRFATDALDHIGMGRYCRQIQAPKGFGDDGLLQRVLREENADFVVPLCESVQQRLWGYPEELTRKVIPLTTEVQRDALLDRPTMYKLVSSAGVPTPEMVRIDDPSQLPHVGAQFGYPYVLRGTQGLGGDQVRIVNDAERAAEAFRYLKSVSPGAPFAQKFISGRRCLIGGLFDHGRMLRWFSQTTLECNSPPTGPSTRVMSVRDTRLTSYAEKLFAALGWSGLACAEFIATDNGDYMFLEVNPRPWAAIQAAHVCGVPLFDMFADYLLGREPAPQAEFPHGREVPLFPQYLTSRLFHSKFSAKAILQGLTHAPWTHPFLMLHHLRSIWWAWRG